MITKISPLAPKNQKKTQKISGVSIASTHCGLKNNGKEDLVLIKFQQPSDILSVFTKSMLAGSPIKWNKSICKKEKVSAILINSGNANVFNGTQGDTVVKKIVKTLASKINSHEDEIYLASTGVIGEPLDANKIIKKIPFLINNLKNDSESWLKAANAIRTTDTYPKVHSEKFNGKGSKFFINGIAKGSGMIAPNMATMLSFIITDANVSKLELKKKFSQLIEKTFNSITVDSEMSTSDMVLLVNIGRKQAPILDKTEKKDFFIKLEILMEKLAQYIVRDGEGASKFITINISGAKNNNEAKTLAMSIANSPLFKTAMAGSDSNWGRIIMALGKSNIKLDAKTISIKFGDFFIFRQSTNFSKKNLSKINNYLLGDNIEISISVGNKKGKARVWTCDFTKNYISINADYRS